MTAEAAAKAVGCGPTRSIIASTGVIGEPLDAGQVRASAGRAGDRPSPMPSRSAARAIMTTDTYPKLATRKVRIGGVPRRHQRLLQGRRHDRAGHGDHARASSSPTRPSPSPRCRRCWPHGADKTFNCITIDSDTSTSDTVPAVCHRRGSKARPAPRGPRRRAADRQRFAAALHDLMHELAMRVVKDGEGLTQVRDHRVRGAESGMAARRIGFAVANSPLVKTAIAGEDPNWGRVVMAVGKTGEAADRDKLSIRLRRRTWSRQGR